MRSASAPTKFNHDENIQDVDIIELIPIEQVIKLPSPPPSPLIDNAVKYVEMESTINEQEILEEQEGLKRNVSNTNTLSSIM